MFRYSDGRLLCEDVDLEEIARSVGTPCYVYSAQSILIAYRAYDDSFGSLPHLICYAVKANSNLAILALLARTGSGFDIVGKGIANPLASFWSSALMLEHLGETGAAAALMAAIERVVADPALHTADIGGKASTAAVTEAIVGFIAGRNT